MVPFYNWVIFHCIYVPQLLYKSICWPDAHLCCFRVLAIVDSAAWTYGYMCLFQLWPGPVVGLLGHIVLLFLVCIFFFKEYPYCSPSNCIHLHFYQPCERVPFLPHLLQHLLLVDFLMTAHPDCCELISHCSYDFHFSDKERCWAPFHVFVSHLHVLFGEMSV